MVGKEWRTISILFKSMIADNIAGTDLPDQRLSMLNVDKKPSSMTWKNQLNVSMLFGYELQPRVRTQQFWKTRLLFTPNSNRLIWLAYCWGRVLNKVFDISMVWSLRSDCERGRLSGTLSLLHLRFKCKNEFRTDSEKDNYPEYKRERGSKHFLRHSRNRVRATWVCIFFDKPV